MKKTKYLALIILALFALAGTTLTARAGAFEPAFVTFSTGTVSHVYTNIGRTFGIAAIYIQDAQTSTMTVDVVNQSGFTNQIIGTTTGTTASYSDSGGAVTLLPGAKLIVTASTNVVKMTFYRLKL